MKYSVEKQDEFTIFTMGEENLNSAKAPNLKTDLKFLKQKIANGAEYIVTQMFFDNTKYFDFVDKCRAEGINVPIIPGIKPITTKSQA